MNEIKWTNYFVTSLAATGAEGHLPADALPKRIFYHDGAEAYHCAYDLEERPTFKDYSGLMRPALGYVWFDFDSHDGGREALTDTRAFVAWLGVKDVFICYSGSKGFHVGVPFGYFGLTHSADLGTKLLQLATHLRKTSFKTLDTTIYNANRKFRALGSKHPKTGLYKVKLSEHMLAQPLEDIQAYAKSRGFTQIVPPPPCAPLPQLVESLTPVVQAHIVAQDKKYVAPSGEAAFANCSFLRFARDEQARVTEPQWYAALSIVSRFKDGRKQCHQISYQHPKYSVGECNDKIDQALKESAPRTCENVATLYDGCAQCPLNGKINSPVNILTSDEKKELKERKPKELDIAKILVAHADGTLMRQEKSIFRYQNGHWKELSVTQLDTFKKGIMEVYGGTVTSRAVDSTFTTFRRELPPVPEGVNLFDPHPFCVNFQNGTLHVRQDQSFFYHLEFLAHRKEDYLNTVIPFDYLPDNQEQNTAFLDMLGRIFKGDSDIEEKIRAVRQMYGACLIPAFPRLFFLYGPSGSGKSTLMLIAKKFLSENNISGVPPSKFKGFLMEPMIGKLANIVTDVDTRHPIQDSEIKMIIDRTPVMIERKGITNIHGRLPAIHLFGGNAIPPTLEGALGAHKRRWTFIECRHTQVGDENDLYNKEFHQWVFEQSPQGVLNFALEGLKDLLAQRGHYTTPKSGQEKMMEWQRETDTVALFLEDIEEGDVFGYDEAKSIALYLNPKEKINRSKLYEIYEKWSENSGHAKFTTARTTAPLTRNNFFNALRSKGFQLKVTRGDRNVYGFSLGVAPEAEY